MENVIIYTKKKQKIIKRIKTAQKKTARQKRAKFAKRIKQNKKWERFSNHF